MLSFPIALAFTPAYRKSVNTFFIRPTAFEMQENCPTLPAKQFLKVCWHLKVIATGVSAFLVMRTGTAFDICLIDICYTESYLYPLIRQLVIETQKPFVSVSCSQILSLSARQVPIKANKNTVPKTTFVLLVFQPFLHIIPASLPRRGTHIGESDNYSQSQIGV